MILSVISAVYISAILELTGSSNIIVNIPATTAQMTIPEATYVFSAITDKVAQSNGDKYYCGTYTETTFDAGADGSPCVMGAVLTVILPSDAPALYLHGDGLPITTFSFSQTLRRVKQSPESCNSINLNHV